VADAQLRHPARHALREVVVDALVHDEPLRGDATLPGVLDARLDGDLRRLLQIGAREHDERVRAAQLQHDFLEIAACRLADAPAGAFASGERGGGNPRVLEQLSDAVRLDEQRLEHSLRESRPAEDLLYRQRRLGNVRRVLEKPDVSGDQRGRGEPEDLPEREVPRHDREHDAERLVPDEAFHRIRLHLFVGDEPRTVLRVVAAADRALVHLGQGGALQLAHLQRHHPTELFASGLEDVGGTRHPLGPLGGRSVALHPDGGGRAGEFFLDLRVRVRSERADGLASGRVDGCDGHGAKIYSGASLRNRLTTSGKSCATNAGDSVASVGPSCAPYVTAIARSPAPRAMSKSCVVSPTTIAASGRTPRRSRTYSASCGSGFGRSTASYP